MGHTQASFAEADFLKHLLGGLEVAAGAVPDEACGAQAGGDEPTVEAFVDPATGPAPLAVRLSASGVDPDGGALVYRWTFSEDPGSGAFGPTVNRTYPTAGTYTATVTVTDDEGDTASDDVTITVGEAESEPPEIIEATADVTSGPAPLDVLFQAVAEDPEGGALTYRWEFGDASGGSVLGEEAEHRYLEPGVFTAVVTVTDETGASATAEIVITVTDPPGNRPPAVEGAAVPASGKAPLAVRFTANGSDPDGDALTYRWDFGDGSPVAAGRSARHTYTRNGVFTATVTATDRGGLTATDEVTITVGNPAGGQAPTVQVAADPTTGTAPLAVNFSAAGSDPDGDAITYAWTFGDGGSMAGQQASHTYTAAGSYTATVTATDTGGKSASATVTITVAAPAAPRAAGGVLPAGGGRRQGRVAHAVGAVAARLHPPRRPPRRHVPGHGDAAAGLWASKGAARALGLASRGLARRTFACEAGETVDLRLRPTAKVRRAIAAKQPRSLRISVALAVEGGAAVTRTLTIRR